MCLQPSSEAHGLLVPTHFNRGFRNLSALQGVAHKALAALATVGEVMEEESATQCGLLWDHHQVVKAEALSQAGKKPKVKRPKDFPRNSRLQ